MLTVKSSSNTTLNAGNNYTFYVGSGREVINASGLGFSSFTNGFPAGRVGLYTEHAGADFDYIHLYPHDKPADLGGRWDRYSSYTYDSTPGCISLHNTAIGSYYPTLLRGVKHQADKPWRATFRFRRSSASRNRDGLQFLFNGQDPDQFDAIRVYHQSGSVWNSYGVKITGGKSSNVSGTATAANVALAANQSDDLWIRVEYTPSSNKVTLKSLVDNTGEPSNSTWSGTGVAYESTNFNMTGGRVGFKAVYGIAYVKEFKIETDNDENGTFTTEYVDDFGQSWSTGYADIEHDHDATGNLTFDGTFKFTYDAWNRLIKVQNAYRDPDAPSAVQTGSTIADYRYDGLNRRVERKITNSGDLDATYHDYYRDWQLVETRNGSDQVLKQHIWGLQYIDELVAVVNNPDIMGASTFDHEFDIDDAKIYMAAHNSLFNVMGLFEFSRMSCDHDNDGDIDFYDWDIYSLNGGFGPTSEGPVKGDYNYDGFVDQTDQNLVDARQGITRSVPVERYEYTLYGERQVYISAGTADPKAMSPVSRSQRVMVDGVDTPIALNDVGFQGKRHDGETGLVYHNRRMTHPRLGRFMQNDPLGYVDGMNDKAAYFVMRGGVDPYGLDFQSQWDYWSTFTIALPVEFANSTGRRIRQVKDGISDVAHEGVVIGGYGVGAFDEETLFADSDVVTAYVQAKCKGETDFQIVLDVGYNVAATPYRLGNGIYY